MWPFKKKRKRLPVTYQGFLTLFPCCTPEYQEELLSILKKQGRPSVLCGQTVPENFNGLTYGTLDDLHDIKEGENVPFELARIILGATKEQVLQEDVNKVYGFANFAREEIDKINKLFDSIKPHHTSEEIQAGIEEMNFGSFGTLDWYAKRQGITNQNEVRDVAWIRIFQCMKMDNEKAEFEKRLHDVYAKKAKAKK